MTTELGPKYTRSRVGLPIVADEKGGLVPMDRAVAMPRDASAPPTYYDVPFLKKPTWTWEIPLYFFFEAISSGSFIIASIGHLIDAKRYDTLSRAGYYLSFAAFLPCPPLLIADLGRPERFHHMLRMFKRTSPMSHGSWALMAYGVPMAMLTLGELIDDLPIPKSTARDICALIPTRTLGVLGIPCAMMLTTYPGVLLNTTSNPLWSKSRLLGALFAASSIHAGAAATSLALQLLGERDREHSAERVEEIEHIATLAEGALLAAYLVDTGRHAAPLVSGKYSKLFWIGAVGVGIVAPAAIRMTAPKERKRGLFGRMLGSALALAGSVALKYAFTYAGREAARDARLMHDAARPNESATGWGPRADLEVPDGR